jgi:hypothetical protein
MTLREAATPLREMLIRPLPGSKTHAILAFALFAAVQVTDASLTAAGVSRFGVSMEANPLVAFYIDACGLMTGLFATKALAIAAGAILHASARYLALAVLTVIFVFAAIVPWALALALV